MLFKIGLQQAANSNHGRNPLPVKWLLNYMYQLIITGDISGLRIKLFSGGIIYLFFNTFSNKIVFSCEVRLHLRPARKLHPVNSASDWRYLVLASFAY